MARQGYARTFIAIQSLSLATGFFPSEFKKAMVLRPLLKKVELDASQLKQNYRPMSDLPFLTKLLERVVHAIRCMFSWTATI